MPPKLVSQRPCSLCSTAFGPPAGSAAVVVRRRAVSNIFWCANSRCVGRDGWHAACVAGKMDASDTELGMRCSACDHVTWVRRVPGWCGCVKNFFWTSYARLPTWAPWLLSLAFMALQDLLACIIGFFVIVIFNASSPHIGTFETNPEMAKKMIERDIPATFEALRSLRPNRTGTSFVWSIFLGSYITGWITISTVTSLLSCVFCVHRRWRRHTSHGLVVAGSESSGD